MKVERKVWPPRDQDEVDMLTDNPPSFAVDARGERVEQPAFGIEIGWNRPGKLHQPYISVSVWRWFIQIGWLYY